MRREKNKSKYNEIEFNGFLMILEKKAEKEVEEKKNSAFQVFTSDPIEIACEQFSFTCYVPFQVNFARVYKRLTPSTLSRKKKENRVLYRI